VPFRRIDSSRHSRCNWWRRGILASGPIVAAFTGAGVAGATGGLLGGLLGLGYPEIEAKFVDEKVGKGSVMIALNSDEDKIPALKASLEDMNPEKVTVH